ncbi:MAG: N-acetyl-gamma-glutamyl-phosphate reductase [Rickettsiales bacterium]|nr:N-acetyl-gamma-glutamyl-phosphate reductase [Rickettsiales bacterium]
MKKNVAIFGPSGYTGTQLLSLLINHPYVNISGVFGNRSEGKFLSEFISIPQENDIKILSPKVFKKKNIDLVFLCLPHKKSFDLLKHLEDLKIIDLSSDYRFYSSSAYKKWYDHYHPHPKVLKKFVYGLTELNRHKIKKAKYVANPGCYPTSVLIPILPLFKEKVFFPKNIIIDSKSGVSGAGRGVTIEKLFFEVNENFKSYNVEKHRHLGEIQQEIFLYKKKINISFVPHLLPLSRGILSTIYFDGDSVVFKKLKQFYKKFFKNEKFINFFSKDIPSLKSVNGTNNLNFSIHQDYDKKKIIIISCIDNLIKGAAGQALQNMNLMFDFKDTEGLNIYQLAPK